MAHWTKHLTEAGNAFRMHVDRLEAKHEQIELLKQKIASLEYEARTIEREINEIAAQHWTEEEIQEAKNTSIHQ